MTTCINVLINNAATSLQSGWPHTPTVRESESCAFCVLLSGVRSESAKLNALKPLKKIFVRVCKRWFISKREEVHHGRSY